MANYGDKYTSSFTDTDGKQYDVVIAEKDYVGATQDFLLGGTPLIHTHETDEPRPAIKGSSMRLTYINQSNTLPISTWYSEDDTYYRLTVTLQQNSQILFIGFLVQDDSSEELVDYDHEVTLSFNDGLGLLKDIPLNQNLPAIGITATVKLDFVSPVPENFVYLYNTSYVPTTSSSFSVSGHIDSTANATFSPTAVTYLGDGNYKCEVTPLSFTADTVAWRSVIAGSGNIDLLRRNTLLDLIRICLYNTGLEIETHYFVNMFEENHDVSRVLFEQTYIDTKTFLEGDKWKSCWDVLEYIFKRFGCTLFQASGSWKVVRWNELRYDLTPPAFVYDSNMAYDSTTVIGNSTLFGYGQPTYPEHKPYCTLIRPYKFAKEKFDYKQPEYILYNSDFQILGSLIRTYTSGSDTINEYEATGFYAPSFSPSQEFFIRVTSDTATGNERSRMLIIKGVTGDTARSVVGTPFELSQGDGVEVSYSFRTTKSQAGPSNIVLAIGLWDGSNYLYPDETTKLWGSGLGWTIGITTGDNTNQPHNAEFKPNRTPNNGILYVFFPQACFSASSTDETEITSITVRYLPLINENTNAVGQTHTTTRGGEIKNNSDDTIYIDDGPRNNIAGTLFLASFTGNIQTRTNLWYRITNNTERLRIGEITTYEKLIANQIIRNKIEGTFYGLYQNGIALNQLSVIEYNAFVNYYFILGRTEIDYRNNNVRATLYEVIAETESTEVPSYNFSYLYDTK